MKNKNYYIGLDIGTDSVGYAACDEEYNLLKFHGNDVWGSTIFDAASLKSERRSFRSSRRRLQRRKARILFLQEIFAKEISKVDEKFYKRLSESRLLRSDVSDKNIIFVDKEYTDVQYYRDYPTIHHLIVELMNSKEPHDIRLVYLACSWLITHRGHFLSNVDEKHIDEIRDIGILYQHFKEFFTVNDYVLPWGDIDVDRLGKCLKKKGIKSKYRELITVFIGDGKPSKEITDDFPFSFDAILHLLAGGQVKLKDLFGKDEYDELSAISLGMDEEKYAELMVSIGDDYEMISYLRMLYDWSVLAETLGDSNSISEAKVHIYEQHKKDLKHLKYFIRKYAPEQYNEMFRNIRQDNYVAYSYHSDKKDVSDLKRKASIDDLSKYVKKVVSSFANIEDKDMADYNDMLDRLSNNDFLPKQKTTDNRVIPYQLYLYELRKILSNASDYLPFLSERDSRNMSNADKIVLIFKFKLPYFVGPLNSHSQYAWLKRTEEKITPWNYTEVIDFDESEKEFIKRMTNQCTYIPGEYVLPKDSLCYHRFMVLNEINNLRINGEKISVALKQEIYHELFEKRKKVSRKVLAEYLVSTGYIEKGQEDLISGIDIEIKSNLMPQIAFKKLLEQKVLLEEDVEKIIEMSTYAEDKSRLKKWLSRNYAHLSEDDRKYICSIRIKDFGRLSRYFLCEFEAPDKFTGEAITILGTLWNTNDNLMEILSDKYEFKAQIEEYTREYYDENQRTLSERLDSMYVSNSVKRPIYRTFAIINDLKKAFGMPKKIFVEMARGGNPNNKGKRTQSRYEQIREFYNKCNEEDVRDLKHSLSAIGEYVDNKLQSDRLFLYYMQFGKCAYSGEEIKLEDLMSGSKEYDVDHIFPQAYVKDDSIINNKVLVLSKINGSKKDKYPIDANIRNKMGTIWSYWHHVGTISDEKYRRLTRSSGFTDEEKYGFINRQLTETSQSTKVVAQILKEQYPETEIIYVKARLTSEFRQEFNIVKSRSYNDLHHAVDAYLNIVTGNVYNARFSKRFFSIDRPYSLKTKTIFSHEVTLEDQIVWDPQSMIEKVKLTAKRNTAHITKYAFFRTGGFFDQMPVKKGFGLVPLKKGLSTEKYGGYNKASVMFFIPVKYKTGKKNDIMIMPVELMYGRTFLHDSGFAEKYAFQRLNHILGKSVDEVSFPMGMRPWKVNTVLSLDGFRVCITGTGNGGKSILPQPMIQFSTDEYWRDYIKRLDSYIGKVSKNQRYIYDKEYDKISKDDNIKLYDLFVDKLTNTIYKKRMNNPVDTIVKGRDRFIELSLNEQARSLLNVLQVFGRMSGGCDLSSLGGKPKAAATVSFSSMISNWKKYYSDVRVIDMSPSGLWEKKSDNILEML